jgi:hypothetical protein
VSGRGGEGSLFERGIDEIVLLVLVQDISLEGGSAQRFTAVVRRGATSFSSVRHGHSTDTTTGMDVRRSENDWVPPRPAPAGMGLDLSYTLQPLPSCWRRNNVAYRRNRTTGTDPDPGPLSKSPCACVNAGTQDDRSAVVLNLRSRAQHASFGFPVASFGGKRGVALHRMLRWTPVALTW